MNSLYGPDFASILAACAVWLGSIISSLFPWPAIVLFAISYRPLRSALDKLVESLADSIRTLRRLKAVGVELTLDPVAAREIAAKSSDVVLGDYKRKADEAVERQRVWDKFTQIIENVVRPLAQEGFRSTIHIEDVLQPETLYQLVEYVYTSEPPSAHNTRGRRNSIRFGIIGRAWRLGRSDYDPNVTTDETDLVKLWGMTQAEAAGAGRGRRSFAVILLRDASGGYSGLIFIDAQSPNLFGKIQTEELERKINDVAQKRNGLSESLARVRNALAQEFRGPIQR